MEIKIKEAYCSYEVAKLLVKKGFNSNLVQGALLTHQLAMAWVRSKGYSIEVYSTAIGWHWQICKVNGTSIAFADILPAKGKNEGGVWDDYDECTEAALKYALENLI